MTLSGVLYVLRTKHQLLSTKETNNASIEKIKTERKDKNRKCYFQVEQFFQVDHKMCEYFFQY